jgi:hypothetical protein
MTQDLAYDMMLEVQGIIRSFRVRTKLDRELRVGETFSLQGRLQGRYWLVSDVHRTNRGGVDRRLIAREADVEGALPLSAPSRT